MSKETETDSNDNEDIEPELICLRGCQGCVERNNWTWGLFQVKDHLGEYSENIPIPTEKLYSIVDSKYDKKVKKSINF